jgi:hypothetical protein
MKYIVTLEKLLKIVLVLLIISKVNNCVFDVIMHVFKVAMRVGHVGFMVEWLPSMWKGRPGLDPQQQQQQQQKRK